MTELVQKQKKHNNFHQRNRNENTKQSIIIWPVDILCKQILFGVKIS